MDTSVPLFHIDKTRAWKKNVRRDNSIRVSRIHRRYYTPPARKTFHNPPPEPPPDLNVDPSWLEKVANTLTIKRLCTNIKREMIGEDDESATPVKKVKVESDSDDEPLLALREKRADTSEDEEDIEDLVEETSSGEEWQEEQEEREDQTRGRARMNNAASTISWAPAYAPAFGRARRVRLPDRAQLRRNAGGVRVAQVAPITAVSIILFFSVSGLFPFN